MPVYITAHRGMGVTAKRRDLFIKGAEFYPENSIIAFREAIKAGADALECDIHVSKDHVAMVIHGNKITDYAYYIGGDVGNRQFLSDGNKLCSAFTKQEIQTNFALRKKLVKAHAEDFNASEEMSAWQYKLSQDPDTYKIPTLTELLSLVSQENQERQKRQQPPILLNIELKGKDSGFITLAKLHLSKNDSVGILKDFIVRNRIHTLTKVRTNVMLSTGTLYGSYALSGNEDFDLKLGINEISDEGFEIIQKFFTQGYDGIDISLFDFDHKSCNAVATGIRLSKNDYPIVGVTASNWKGNVMELSPSKPCMAVQRALKISQENNIDVLMKVDEPELFKSLLKLLLTVQEEDLSTKLLVTTVVDVEESEDEVVIKQDNLEKLSEVQQRWWNEVAQLEHRGYDVHFDARPDNLAPSIKPPRGERKNLRP